MAWAIIIVAIGLTALQIWQDRKTFPRFEAMEKSHERRQTMRYWTIDSFMRYGLLGLAGLYLLDQLEAFATLPEAMAAHRDALATRAGLTPERLSLGGYGLAAVMAIGLAAGGIAGFFINPENVPKQGVGTLLARNWKEAGWASLVSANAGLSEEIFFRALLPIAVFQVSGSLLAAMLVATVLFAVAHAYQGLPGIISSGILGGLFMMVFVATGALWLVILLHALIDLRGLVLLPYSLGWFSGKTECPN